MRIDITAEVAVFEDQDYWPDLLDDLKQAAEQLLALRVDHNERWGDQALGVRNAGDATNGSHVDARVYETLSPDDAERRA